MQVEITSPLADCLNLQMNYFQLFGIEELPTVDRTLVAAKYFELQKATHPDFFTNDTEIEQEDALQRSADINKAFNIFQNEQKTIEYFLQTMGIIEHDEKYQLPPDFLMEMMEINETIGEQNKEQVLQQVNDYENKLWQEVRPLIDNYKTTERNNVALAKLKEYYYKKKYLKRILDRLGD